MIRFNIFGKQQRDSVTHIHNVRDLHMNPISLYYFTNMFFHGYDISQVVNKVGADVAVLSNLAPSLSYIFVRSQKIPIVFDLPDYFPTSASGYIAETNSLLGNLLTGFFSVLLQWIIRKCDLVTVASLALLGYAKRIGVRNPIYIPNGISDHFFKSYNGRRIREKFGFADDEIVIGYVGSLEFWLDMEPLLDGLRMALDAGIPAKLLLVGGGLHTNFIKKIKLWIAEKKLEDYVFWAGYVPYLEVPEYISAMDLTTIPFKIDNPTAYFAGPNKLWEYLSQGKPVLATSIPEVIYRSNLVEIVSSARDYFEIFYNFQRDRSYFLIKAKKGQKKAKNFTWENSANQMQNVLLNVCTHAPNH